MKPQHNGVDDAEASPPNAAHEVFGGHFVQAEAYRASLATDGAQRGFIGPREVPRLWERHILNCAVIGEAIPRNSKVADIGSGAGLPGIPLAIARPDLKITLIEPLLKRSVYLDEVVSLLGLENVTVVRGRAEEKAVKTQVGLFDVVTSRAVAPLGRLAAWSLPLVRKGGKMLAMKGVSVGEELTRDAKDIRKAGGGEATILTVGEQHLQEPTTLISIPRVK